MLIATVGTLAVVGAAVALSRARSVGRYRALVRDWRSRPVGTDGIVVGAEPVVLEASGMRGLLVLHGFNDTPQSVSAFAHAMHARGWAVRAPLLARHGRTLEEMALRGSAAEWMGSARAEWAALRSRYSCAVLAGQSMGGTIATILAAEAPPPAALVLLAPYLRMSHRVRFAARAWPVWQWAMPFLFADPRRGLVDEAARAASLGHGVFTPRLVNELRRLVEHAGHAAPNVTAPTLAVHARRDYRIPSGAATRAFARLGAQDKTLVWLDGSGHVVAADCARDEVFAIVGEWLERHVRASRA